jgi:hypothetical protein
VAERPRSLAVHVLEQIELMFEDPAERRIAVKIAEGLDEAGYCRLDAAAVAEGVATDIALVEKIWGAPAPDGASRALLSHRCRMPRSAARRRNRLDPAMKALLDNLDLVAPPVNSASSAVAVVSTTRICVTCWPSCVRSIRVPGRPSSSSRSSRCSLTST